MAKLYADATGAIIRWTQTDAEETRYGAPAEATASLEYDPATNPEITHAMLVSGGSCRLEAGAFVGATGTAVAVQAPSGRFSDLLTLRTIVAAWEAGTAPTAAQALVLLRVLLRDLGHMA